MPAENVWLVSSAVEGPIDEAVLRCVLEQAGLKMGLVYGKQGKAYLAQKISAFNSAARHSPWVVLADLDNDFDCAPALVKTWLPHPAPLMRLRIAVREVETWLLGDRERIAGFLGISGARVPLDPEALPDPKGTVVGLARRSRKRDIREGLVPREGSGRVVGSEYTSRLIEFVIDAKSGWRPLVASKSVKSLKHCLERLRLVFHAT